MSTVTIDTEFLLSAERLRAKGVALARAEDIASVHHLATDLLDVRIAPMSLLETIRQHNPITLFVTHPPQSNRSDGVTGFLALLPLTKAGVDALWDGSFDALAVETRWIVTPREKPHGVYVWGVGAKTARARAHIWGLARYLEQNVYPELPHFARPATERGVALMRVRGYCPLARLRPGSPETFWVRMTSHESPGVASN